MPQQSGLRSIGCGAASRGASCSARYAKAPAASCAKIWCARVEGLVIYNYRVYCRARRQLLHQVRKGARRLCAPGLRV
jgi:hypothetical protein